MKMLKSLLHTPSGYSTRRLLQWLWGILRHHRLQAGLNTLLGCLTVCLDFAFIWATKWAIDIATHKADAPLALAAAGVLWWIGLKRRWFSVDDTPTAPSPTASDRPYDGGPGK